MGAKDGRIGTFLDKRRKLHADAALAEAKLRILLENISGGVAVYQAINDGEDFVFTDFNSAAEQIEHISKEQLLGKSVVEVFPGVKDIGLLDIFRRVWKTGTPEYLPVSIYKDDRITGWRENHVFKLPSGEIMAIYDDVTRHKQNQFAIKMSEQCFRAIADYTYGWEVWISPAGRPMWTNPASQRVTGYLPAEILTMTDYPQPIVYQKDRERMQRAFLSALKGSSGNCVQFRLLHKNGKIFWAEMSWQPIYDEKGAPLGHRESVRDVTARREAEEALKKSEHEKQTILDSIPEHVIHYDKELTILWANHAACRSAKMRREELIGNSCYDVWSREDVPCDGCPVLEAIRTGCNQEGERATPDGRMWFIQGSPIFNEYGAVVGAVEVTMEITQRKRIEESLRKSEEKYRRFVNSHHGH